MRYADLRPCHNAFIDTRTPGSEAKENFTIIGPGVSENPEQYVHIAERHGFNIGGARQPPGCVNSQHSHDTAEVFVVHSGRWRFDLGEHGDAAQILCEPGDVISLPTGMFRGFTNVGSGPGFLWAVLGGDHPGRVLWAPRVFDMAADYGLVLLESGSLVDVAAGQVVPAGVAPMPRTTADQVAALRIPTAAEAEKLVARDTPGANGTACVIGDGGPLAWPHGFEMVRIDLRHGETFGDSQPRSGAEVWFVHRGQIAIEAADGLVVLGEGDTVSLPVDAPTGMTAQDDATVFAVRQA